MAYLGGNLQTYGLTQRKPRPDYSAAILGLSQYLPELYAAKDTKEATEKELGLKEQELSQSKELSNLALAQDKADLEAQQKQWEAENAATALSLQQQKDLAAATAEANKKATTASNILGGANVAANAANALKGTSLFSNAGKTASEALSKGYDTAAGYANTALDTLGLSGGAAQAFDAAAGYGGVADTAGQAFDVAAGYGGYGDILEEIGYGGKTALSGIGSWLSSLFG